MKFKKGQQKVLACIVLLVVERNIISFHFFCEWLLQGSSKSSGSSGASKKHSFSKKEREQLNEYGSLQHPGDEEGESSLLPSINGKATKTIIDDSVVEARHKHKRFKAAREGFLS